MNASYLLHLGFLDLNYKVNQVQFQWGEGSFLQTVPLPRVQVRVHFQRLSRLFMVKCRGGWTIWRCLLHVPMRLYFKLGLVPHNVPVMPSSKYFILFNYIGTITNTQSIITPLDGASFQPKNTIFFHRLYRGNFLFVNEVNVLVLEK